MDLVIHMIFPRYAKVPSSTLGRDSPFLHFLGVSTLKSIGLVGVDRSHSIHRRKGLCDCVALRFRTVNGRKAWPAARSKNSIWLPVAHSGFPKKKELQIVSKRGLAGAGDGAESLGISRCASLKLGSGEEEHALRSRPGRTEIGQPHIE
jgi:hypothetical protein